MKKIGILFGQENSFPQAFIDRINQKGEQEIRAEFVRIDKVLQAEPLDYAVIVDRISQNVPFYRAALKNAALNGTAVINNPFWQSADEKFLSNTLAVKLGIPVPKTAVLPSKEHPAHTNVNSFRNLAYPLHWEAIFNHVGFPAYLKPFDGEGWKDVYRVTGVEDLWKKYDQTGRQVMLLQEEIEFQDYFRCYCIGGKHVRIMRYQPGHQPHHGEEHNNTAAEKKLLNTMTDYAIKLNRYLGYDFNTVEFAVRDGIPYAIDFCNPAPEADMDNLGQENFEWVVETAATYAIKRAKEQKPGTDNLTWGEFIRSSVTGKVLTTAKPAAEKISAETGIITHKITDEQPKKAKAAKNKVEKLPAITELTEKSRKAAKAKAAKEPAAEKRKKTVKK